MTNSIYSVKGHLYHVKRKRLSPLRFTVSLVVGLVIIYAGFMGPWAETRWIGLLLGILIIADAAINALRVHEVAEPFAAVKEIEVEPRRIIFRCKDREEIVPQIQKITVGVFQRGRVWGRYVRAGPRWIGITGQTQDGKPWRTLIGKKYGVKKVLKLGGKELASLRDDLQRYFGSKIEEKKVRFVS